MIRKPLRPLAHILTARAEGGNPDAIERENIVERATAAGKVIPLSADEIAATPIATLKSMVEKIPATVPLSATTPSKDGKPALKPLSATEIAVCKNLRISEEDYRKANP